jgi:hypothetical protein
LAKPRGSIIKKKASSNLIGSFIMANSSISPEKLVRILSIAKFIIEQSI